MIWPDEIFLVGFFHGLLKINIEITWTADEESDGVFFSRAISGMPQTKPLP